MKHILLTGLLTMPMFAGAQFYHQEVLPDLQGDPLLQELVNVYKTSTTLDDSAVKDTLMAVIYYEADQQQVRCVYTDYAKPLSPDSPDPNQEVFDEGQSTGINVEHIYPRNKGARIGIAESDMHHLAPAKVNVNGDRNNLPFGELPDNQTDRWYYLNIERTSIPSQDIDLYSEWTNMAFEPRESFKGNVARAVMYFYTMYRSAADMEDPDFFDLQIETLCEWHYDDPVDSTEWHRTFLIADFQEGKANPFVLDCSVAARTYCGESTEACDRTVAVAEADDIADDMALYPNPVSDQLYVNHGTDVELLTMYDLTGTVQRVVSADLRGSTQIDVTELLPGMYLIVADRGWHGTFIKK